MARHYIHDTVCQVSRVKRLIESCTMAALIGDVTMWRSDESDFRSFYFLLIFLLPSSPLRPAIFPARRIRTAFLKNLISNKQSFDLPGVPEMADHAGAARGQDPVPITHVIFDLDGLLLNTEIFYTQILEEYCIKYGKTFTWEVKQRQMGRKEEEAALVAIEAYGLPVTVDEYIKHVREELTRLLPTSQFLPGAVKLVQHLHKHKIPLAIATGSDTFSFGKKTMNHKDFLLMFGHCVLSGDDPEVKVGKPAPDVFLVCAKRFPDTPDPKNVLVFEDALNGVKAAVAAGMRVVAVPDERADLGEFNNNGATVILKSLVNFDPTTFGFPPYDSHSNDEVRRLQHFD